MTFGLLAVIFGVIFIIQWGVQIKTLNELSAKVEKNFSLVLPERNRTMRSCILTDMMMHPFGRMNTILI